MLKKKPYKVITNTFIIVTFLSLLIFPLLPRKKVKSVRMRSARKQGFSKHDNMRIQMWGDSASIKIT